MRGARAAAVLLALALPAAAQLDADFTATPLSGTNPLTVTLTDTTTGGEVHFWDWKYGDGSGSFEQHPVHVFTQPGPHTVRLMVFTAVGFDIEQKLDLIDVDPAPLVPGFSADVTSGPMALSVSFTDTTTGSAPTDWLGSAVALDGTSALVGAPRTDGNATSTGAAYLFDVVTGAPGPVLTRADAQGGDSLGKAVALAGDLALVGAPVDDSASLFDAVTGQELHRLAPVSTMSGVEVGASVVLDGDRAVVGGPDHHQAARGAVHVFDVATGAQLDRLLDPEGAPGDGFGRSLAADDGLLVVGAPDDDDQGANSGSASLFDLATGTWLMRLLPADGAPYDYFGGAVAIDDGLVVVGAPGYDDGADSTGAVYVFDAATGEQLDKLSLGPANALHFLGWDVALAGTTLLASSTTYMHQPSGSRAVLFDIVSGQHLATLRSSDLAPHHFFASSVALSEEHAVIGAVRADGAVPESGAAYVFDAAIGTWTDLGDALPGSAGAPILSGGGPLLGGCAVELLLEHAAADAPVLLVVGFGALGLPLQGGVLVPTPDLLVALGTDGNGALLLVETWPHHLPGGASLWFQAWIVDAAGPAGFTASNGLRAMTP